MKITIYTETVIDYAHFLRNYEGKCKNLHGHSGLIRIWVRGEEIQLDERDILFDFTNVSMIKELLDHKCLNDYEYFKDKNPTAENACLFVYNLLKKFKKELEYKVRFYETAVGKNTYAEVGDFE